MTREPTDRVAGSVATDRGADGDGLPVAVRRDQGSDLQQVQFLPGQLVAPSGSYRSGGGGDEAVEAFETTGRLGRFGEQAGRNASERCASPETRRCGSRPGCYTGKAVAPGDRRGPPLTMRHAPGVPPGYGRRHAGTRRRSEERRVGKG